VGVLEELVGGEEVRREPPAQPGGVNHPSEGVVRGRVAVDPPGQAMRFKTVEQGLGGVERREVRIRSVDQEPGTSSRRERTNGW
jgi:hypothetical protein